MPAKTTEQFIREAKAAHGSKYDYSKTVYVRALKKVRITCPLHGDFMQTPASHLYNRGVGCGCPDCKHAKTKARCTRTLSEFLKEARAVHGKLYEYDKVKYVTAHTHVIITCKLHGDFEQTPNNHIRGNGCPQCHFDVFTNSRRSSTKAFIRAAKKVHGNKYDYSKVDYYQNKKKVIIGCRKHGYFLQVPAVHLHGAKGEGCGCPRCASSKGELRILSWLKKQEVLVEQQKIFNACRAVNPLIFDFYLPYYNACIEYDGAQHFKAVQWFGGKKSLKNLQKRDGIKNKYCADNGIYLLRIPYSDFKNIPSILNTFLKKLNSRLSKLKEAA